MTDIAAEDTAIVLERTLPHPPEKVWRALTEQPLIEDWLMRNDFQPRLGHKFNALFLPALPRGVHVVHLEAQLDAARMLFQSRWEFCRCLILQGYQRAAGRAQRRKGRTGDGFHDGHAQHICVERFRLLHVAHVQHDKTQVHRCSPSVSHRACTIIVEGSSDNSMSVAFGDLAT